MNDAYDPDKEVLNKRAAHITELYISGMNPESVARRLGTALPDVRRVLRDNVKDYPHKDQSTRLAQNPEFVADTRDVDTVAAHYMCNVSTIYKARALVKRLAYIASIT